MEFNLNDKVAIITGSSKGIGENIAINLVRGSPKEKVNINLDMKLYKDAVSYRDNLFFSKI